MSAPISLRLRPEAIWTAAPQAVAIGDHEPIRLVRWAVLLLLADLAGLLLVADWLVIAWRFLLLGGLVALWAIACQFQQLYRRDTMLGTLRKQLWKSAGTVGISFALFDLLIVGPHVLSQATPWLAAGVVLAWVWLLRMVWHGYMRMMLDAGRCVERAVMLIGEPVQALRLERIERARPGLRFVLTAPIPQPSDSWVEEAVRLGRIDRIFIAGFAQRLTETNSLLQRLARCSVTVTLLPDLNGIQAPVARIDQVSDQPLVDMNVAPLSGYRPRVALHERLGRGIKLGFDLVIGATLLVVLSPILLSIALLVKADGGPVLYAHTRIGRHGRRFRCLKYRTMVVDAEQRLKQLLAIDASAANEWADNQKLTNDPRVTKIGDILRRTSLDELPQLLNVLHGEMSLVGPRPIVLAEIPRYADQIAAYFEVRPGLTGLWQISGRSDTSYAERVRLDVAYVRDWSLRLDLTILIKTIPVVLSRRGAI